MDRSRVTELHFITPLANLASIVQHGILSHERAQAIPHVSIALEEVQDRRRNKRVPGGLRIHEYANVYFDARNPMMYRRLGQRRELAVIRVSPRVLDMPGAVIADGNAAGDGTCFRESPGGLEMLDEERVYAEWWTDDDIFTHWEKKRQRCAEVLVPDCIPPSFITGCYVHNTQALRTCHTVSPGLKVEVRRDVFFD